MKKNLAFLTAAIVFVLLIPANAFAQSLPDISTSDAIVSDEQATMLEGLLSTDALLTPATGTGGLSVYPISVEEKQLNGRPVIVKVYEVEADFNPEYLIEPDFEQGGYLYRESQILKKELDPIVETKKAYQIVTARTGEKNEAEIMTQFAPLMDHSEGGYSGQLELDYSSISTTAEGTTGYSYVIKEAKEYTGFDRNDASYIPKTLSQNGQTLHLADINWTSMGGAVRGDIIVPSAYSATAYYSGTGYGSRPTGYVSTAVYKGEVSMLQPGPAQYFVVYEGFELPVPKKVNVWAWVSALIHICTLSALGWLLWRKYGKSGSLVKTDESEGGYQ